MTRPAFLVGLTLLASLLRISPLHAQCLDGELDAELRARIGLHLEPPRAEADLRAAADLALRARARFDAGAELEALSDLEQAFRLSGDADLAGMLGLSLRAAGRIPEAWLAMRAFLEGATPSVRAALEARVRAAMGEIEAQLGGVRLGGDFGVMGQVLLDGRVIARLPLDASLGGPALRLAPGHVRLEIRAVGRLAEVIEVDLRAGQLVDVAVELPSLAAMSRVGLLPTWPDLDADMAASFALRGRARFAAGLELAALPDLEAAYLLSGDAALAGMLGLSLRAAGRLPEAWVALRTFLHAAPPDARASLEARVRAALGELDAQLGRVAVDADFGTRGQVVLDGRLVAALPLDAALGGELRLPVGHVALQVRGLGRLAQEVELDVVLGALAQLSVQLPAASIGAAGGLAGLDVPPPAAGASLDPWPFVVVAGGVAVVLVIGGVIASVVNDNLTADLSALDCSATPALCEPIRSNLSISEAFEFVGYIGAAVGATVAATIAIVVAVTANASSSVSATAPDLDVDLDVGCDDDEREAARLERRDAQLSEVSGTCAPWAGQGAGLGCVMSF